MDKPIKLNLETFMEGIQKIEKAFRMKYEPDQLDLYYEELRDITDKGFMGCVREIINNMADPPKNIIAEIRTRCWKYGY